MAYLVNVNDPVERGREISRQVSENRNRQRMKVPVSSTNRPPISQDVAANVVNYYNTVLATWITSFNIRPQMLARDLAYYREVDATRTQALAKAYNQAGDTSKVQNVTIPVVMPQVESALAYHTAVFLSGYPIFGVVAVPGQEEAMRQMEATITENSIRGAWPQELMKTLRNGLKYDLGAVEVVWEKKKDFNIGTPEIDRMTVGKVEETYYEGNFVKDLDPYNIILDTRVSPDRNHIEGEVAGYTEMKSAVAMKQAMDNLDPFSTMQFKEAFEAPSTGVGINAQTAGYFIPSVNPDALLPAVQQQPFSWDSFLGGNVNMKGSSAIKYQSAYEWTVLYVRLIPSVFGMGGRNQNHVQIWKFIVVNRAVCIFAQQQTNAHGYLPIIACKPSNDGMGWQSKSFAQNAEPYQYVASALTNSGIESQRRKVYDRIFYDPARVRKSDIDNVSSVARIPVKNSMYNKDIASAIHVSPYRDENVGEILSFAGQVTQMADIANGQNRVQQGQFQKGNKTRKEFDTVMSNSNARQQMAAIGLEYSFFSPIKYIIKSNILQYQPPTTIVDRTSGAKVAIDPTVLRKALLAFKLSDGLLPSEKMVNPEMFTLLLQTAQVIPELRLEYDFIGAFNYQVALQGADWLAAFKRTAEQKQVALQDMQAAALASGNQAPPKPGPAGQEGAPV